MNVNRRTALGVLGAIGAASIASNEAAGQDLPAPLNLPPAPSGRCRGRMTGARRPWRRSGPRPSAACSASRGPRTTSSGTP